MNIQKISLRTSNGIPESLSNLWFRNECDISQIEDAIYDSTDAKELVDKINCLKLLRKFTFDREIETKIRLKSIDAHGNISFLEVYK